MCRLPADATLPRALSEPAPDGSFVSLTRTPDELSIICPSELIPSGESDLHINNRWRCMRVAGPVELSATGVLASLLTPLADARVNICTTSTYDTDYLLVPTVRLAEAVAALAAAGHRLSGT